MKYKGFEVNDNKIDEYVEKLGCSISEACDLILEESGKLSLKAQRTLLDVTKRVQAQERKQKRFARLMKPKVFC